MTLLVTIFLVLINIHNTIQTNSPKVYLCLTNSAVRTNFPCITKYSPYSLSSDNKHSFQAEGLTAIECWVIACIIFVFGALLEYTVILLQLKLQKVGALKGKRYNGYSLGSKNGQRASTSSGPGGSVTMPGAGAGDVTDLMLPRNGTKAGPRKKSSAQGEPAMPMIIQRQLSFRLAQDGWKYGLGHAFLKLQHLFKDHFGSYRSSRSGNLYACDWVFKAFVFHWEEETLNASSCSGVNRPDRFSRTDLIFLCVFPVMFVLFNLAYWTAIYFWRWGEGSQPYH